MTLTHSASSSVTPSSSPNFVDAGPARTPSETAVLDSHLPLTSQAALDARIRQLVPTAVVPQIWLILLDADDIQMPVMLPLGDLPLGDPAGNGTGVTDLLRSLHSEFQVATYVFIVERPGPARVQRADAQWLRLLLGAARDQPFRVRSAYLCHDDGVAAYDASDLDDLAFVEAGRVSPGADEAGQGAPVDGAAGVDDGAAGVDDGAADVDDGGGDVAHGAVGVAEVGSGPGRRGEAA